MRLAFFRRMLMARVVGILALSTILSLAGCGGRGSSAVRSGTIEILAQPASQAVPIGRTATFTVTAIELASPNPGAPLTYQWTRNGVEIPGATASSYTTPTVALADSGTQYQVIVTSGFNSLPSAMATLTAGPRAPALGDVRYLLFQQIPGPVSALSANVGFLGGDDYEINDALGEPLPTGSMFWGGCGWQFSYNFVPSSMDGQFRMYYQYDYLANQSLSSYLASVQSPNVVITSADLQAGGCLFLLGVSWVWTQAGGFDYKLEEVAATEVSAAIANDASAGRIVTAVFYDSASADWALVSYGWQGDTTTVYESQSALVPQAQALSQIQTFANQGYFLSACGSDGQDNYLLVGMRVKGDTLARPVLPAGSSPPPNADNAYWTVVAFEYPTTVAEQ